MFIKHPAIHIAHGTDKMPWAINNLGPGEYCNKIRDMLETSFPLNVILSFVLWESAKSPFSHIKSYLKYF